MRRIGRLLAVGIMVVPFGIASASPASAGSVAPTLTWSTPTPIDDVQGGLTDISCTHKDFCVAVDISARALTYDGTGWSAPEQVTTEPDGFGFETVSCRGRAFCVAGGFIMGLWERHASGWQQAGVDFPSLVDVSCASVTDCVAVSTTGWATHRTSTGWSVRARMAPRGFWVTAVSCARPDFCVAAVHRKDTDSPGYVTVFDGAGWSRPQAVDQGSFLRNISCPSRTFCMAGDDRGRYLRFNGTSWSRPRLGSMATEHVACLSRTMCTAVDLGYVGIWDGTSSKLTRINPLSGLQAAACINETTCFAIEYIGYITPYVDGVWQRSERAYRDPTSGRLTDVSCATSTFCVAVDEDGNLVRYDGVTWTTAHRINRYVAGFEAVSCASAHFCVVLDDAARAWFFDGTRWDGPQNTGPTGYDTLSCAKPHFCMEVGQLGPPAAYRGTRWHETAGATSEGPIRTVSCTSSTFCMSVAVSSRVLRFDGTRWYRGQALATTPYDWSVSCASKGLCGAVNYSNDVSLRQAGAWSTDTVASLSGYQDIACADSLCAAVNGLEVITNAGAGWSSPVSLPVGSNAHVSCASSTFCVAIGLTRASTGAAA